MEVDALGTLAIGFAPALLWLWYLHGKDLEPEPQRLVLLVFMLGCGSAVATLAVRPTLDAWLPWQPPWWRDLLDAFVVTATTEETLKLLAFVLGTCWHRELDEPMDGIVYGAAAGLGFAAVENVVYLNLTGAASVVLARAFTATLAHIACTATVGFFVGLTRFCRQRARWVLVPAGLALAVLLHGTYDFFLFGADGLWWLSLLGALPSMALLLSLKVRWARSRSAFFHPAVRQA